VTPRVAVIAGFAALLAVAVACELVARRPDSGVRPLSAALTAAMRSRGGRVIVLGAWLWLGWHFLAR
jgi:amino acid transporter